MANYNFVIDSSFKPFSFDEMLKPWAIYSNAYEKVEDSYNEYMKKADTFKYQRVSLSKHRCQLSSRKI